MIEQRNKLVARTNSSTPSSRYIGRQHSMIGRKQLVLDASAEALKVRRSQGFGLWTPICVYDLAESMGIEVRFLDIPSMEGMYCKEPGPVIVVSSLRPSGRQAFTCAHELGHHVFKHGGHIDKNIIQQSTHNHSDPREFLADCFAGFLLMPRSAVSQAFAIRGWNINSCTPLQLYIIAGWFGVGYTTLIQHMGNTLHLLPQALAESLARVSPKSIRTELLGREVSEDLILIDSHWSDRSIDIQVGDFIQLPINTFSEGNCVHLYEENQTGSLFCGTAPGIGRFYQPSTGWSAFVRVSRRGFVGRNRFRHLEDTCDE